MSDKAALRLQARRRLAEVHPDQRKVWGELIADGLWSLPETRTARTILLYASLPEEVPTDAIAARARVGGQAVVYPRCLPEGREMTLHPVVSEEELTTIGRFGIREPASHCPTTDLSDVDLAVIPGLAWDRSGNRLGRGAGYYDRLLASPAFRAFRCGLFFSIQELPTIPADPWDRPLDAVVTEGGIWRAAAGEGPQGLVGRR
jgi:5-formyltetrahydrofolate cyclo-ligase